MSNLERSRHTGRGAVSASRQKGVSLIELLVGLTIGLLVIAAALGTMALSKGASTSVSELSQLQQQGSYALRLMGVQFRQAGSVEVVKTPTSLYSFDNKFVGFNGGATVVSGQDGAGSAPDEVSVSNQPSTVLTTQQRDCLGVAVTTGVRMDSTFHVSNGQLFCKGYNQDQPVVANVADFQVTYRVKTSAGTQSMTAADVAAASAWASVSAIEICLDLQGDDGGNPSVGTYQTCRSDASGAPVSASRSGHLHLVFRNLFDLRTQGLG